MAHEESGGVRSVTRALDILGLVSDSPTGVQLREAVGATGLPKTTVLRLMQTLERQGFLWNIGSQTYVPGPALLHLGTVAVDAWRLRPDLVTMMDDLAGKHQETVNLWVRRGVMRVCVAQSQPNRALRHVVSVGDELFLDAGAAAKVLLIGAADALLGDIAAMSPTGPDHVLALRRRSEEAAAAGFAISHGEYEEGLSAVAVPVRSAKGRVVGALTMSGVTVRFGDERIDTLLPGLRACADELGRRGFGAERSAT